MVSIRNPSIRGSPDELTIAVLGANGQSRINDRFHAACEGIQSGQLPVLGFTPFASADTLHCGTPEQQREAAGALRVTMAVCAIVLLMAERIHQWAGKLR